MMGKWITGKGSLRTIGIWAAVLFVLGASISGNKTEGFRDDRGEMQEKAKGGAAAESSAEDSFTDESTAEELNAEGSQPAGGQGDAGTDSEEKEVVSMQEPEGGESFFEVHYIDVGQGDSALILCDSEAMLIDGGLPECSDLIYSYLKKEEVPGLKYLVASHMHDDHVGGLSGALNFTSAEHVLCSTVSYDGISFSNFVKYAEQQQAAVEVPQAGEHFFVGSASVDILGVNSTEDENNSSIVLKVTYGDTSFLFTGDAAGAAEEVLLDSGCDLKSTVLKVGHHGSSDGTTEAFLEKVRPQYAVISAGRGNEYGHPSEIVLNRLKAAGIETFRTDLQGDIIVQSDGSRITIAVEKNAGTDTFVPAQRKDESVSDNQEADPNLCLSEGTESEIPAGTTYVLNKNSRKFHEVSCKSVMEMQEKNKVFFMGTRDECIERGYTPCGNCRPK